MAAGVAWLDFDSDGLLDLFLVKGTALADPVPKGKLPDKSAPRYWNRLYRNTGHEKFVDVTEQAGLQGNGYSMGVAVGDYDNDGKPDLYIPILEGTCSVTTQVTDGARVAGSGWSTGGAFLDYDRDGYLDFAICSLTRRVSGMIWSFESRKTTYL